MRAPPEKVGRRRAAEGVEGKKQVPPRFSEWKDEVRRQRAAEKAAAQRAYESAKALLEDIEKAKEACAAAKAALPDNFAPGEVAAAQRCRATKLTIRGDLRRPASSYSV